MYAISSARQARSAWETALAIAAELGETDYQLRALRALWAEAINSGEFQRALLLAEQFEALAGQNGSADDQIVSDRLIGTALHFLGEQEKALAATERMLERYVASVARSQAVRYQFNQKVSARIIRGRVLWLRGQTDSALRDIEENVAEALTLDHTMSLCNVLTQAACPVALLAGALETAEYYIELLRDHTEARALDIWYTYANCFEGALEIARGNVQEGLERLQPGMEQLRRIGFGHYRTSFLMTRARGLLLVDRATDADAAIVEAMDICQRTGERWCLPELHRLAGEIMLRRESAADIDAAIQAFQRALQLAREQQALAWQLRAATSLVRCTAGQSGDEEARAVLRRVCAQLKEGYDSPAFVEAKALLA
jgi:tetratricopeptide (TPR) repeat protein